MARYLKRRQGVVFLRAASSVWFCSCSTRRTCYDSMYCRDAQNQLSLIRQWLRTSRRRNCSDSSSCRFVQRCHRQMDAIKCLKLNANGTQLIVFGSRLQLFKVKCDYVTVYISEAWHTISEENNFLGIILDAGLLKVRWVISRCCYQVRQTRIYKSLTAETSKLLLHAFINSRLDYCNCILYSAGVVHLKKLVLSKWGLMGCHINTKIWPNHINTSRRFALAACRITNPFQEVHASV